jgi:hypothetical protein
MLHPPVKAGDGRTGPKALRQSDSLTTFSEKQQLQKTERPIGLGWPEFCQSERCAVPSSALWSQSRVMTHRKRAAEVAWLAGRCDSSSSTVFKTTLKYLSIKSPPFSSDPSRQTA